MKKPQKRSSATSKKVSTDPFDNKILAALRGRDFADTSILNAPGYYGDWVAAGSTIEGAQRLVQAVVECYRKERIDCQAKIMYEEEPVETRDGTKYQRSEVPEFQISEESGRKEFTMLLKFKTGTNEQIIKATKKITAASRRLQVVQEQAGGAQQGQS